MSLRLFSIPPPPQPSYKLLLCQTESTSPVFLAELKNEFHGQLQFVNNHDDDENAVVMTSIWREAAPPPTGMATFNGLALPFSAIGSWSRKWNNSSDALRTAPLTKMPASSLLEAWGRGYEVELNVKKKKKN